MHASVAPLPNYTALTVTSLNILFIKEWLYPSFIVLYNITCLYCWSIILIARMYNTMNYKYYWIYVARDPIIVIYIAHYDKYLLVVYIYRIRNKLLFNQDTKYQLEFGRVLQEHCCVTLRATAVDKWHPTYRLALLVTMYLISLANS